MKSLCIPYQKKEKKKKKKKKRSKHWWNHDKSGQMEIRGGNLISISINLFIIHLF